MLFRWIAVVTVLFLSGFSQAAQFDVNQIHKLVQMPVSGNVFDLILLNNHTVWLAAELGPGDRTARVGPFRFDRDVPTRIELGEFDARDIFSIGDHFYVVTSRGSLRDRYLAEFVPTIESPRPFRFNVNFAAPAVIGGSVFYYLFLRVPDGWKPVVACGGGWFLGEWIIEEIQGRVGACRAHSKQPIEFISDIRPVPLRFVRVQEDKYGGVQDVELATTKGEIHLLSEIQVHQRIPLGCASALTPWSKF